MDDGWKQSRSPSPVWLAGFSVCGARCFERIVFNPEKETTVSCGLPALGAAALVGQHFQVLWCLGCDNTSLA